MTHRLAPGALLLAALILPACGDAPTPDGDAPAAGEPAADAERTPAPPFELPDLDGERVSLESLRGKVVVIDFWATWCPPCIFQVPILNEIQEAYRDQGVVVLGVSVDTEGADVVRAFVQEHDVQYRVLMGDEALARRYGAPGFPWMVVVLPDGTRDPSPPHVGLVERDVLEAKLERLTSDAPVSEDA